MRRWYFIGMLSSFALGCFSDPNPTGAACPDGASGCSCYGNGTCDADLVCNADSNCVAQDCQDGSVECPCYGNGTCDAGLACEDNICRRTTGGSGTSVSGSGSATSTSADPTTATAPTSEGDTSASGTATDPTSPGPGSDPTLASDTGLIECDDCSTEEACFPGGLCDANPYFGCPLGTECGVLDTCVSGSTSEICAPPCLDSPQCPTLEGALPPECVGQRCLLPCSDPADCPPSAPVCDTSSSRKISHCVAGPE